METRSINNLLIKDVDSNFYKYNNTKWFWYVDVYESCSNNSNAPRNTIDIVKLMNTEIHKEHLTISLDEFLKIGLKGVEKLVKLENYTKKFNL